MSLRDLVGDASCAPGGASANPLRALADGVLHGQQHTEHAQEFAAHAHDRVEDFAYAGEDEVPHESSADALHHRFPRAIQPADAAYADAWQDAHLERAFDESQRASAEARYQQATIDHHLQVHREEHEHVRSESPEEEFVNSFLQGLDFEEANFDFDVDSEAARNALEAPERNPRLEFALSSLVDALKGQFSQQTQAQSDQNTAQDPLHQQSEAILHLTEEAALKVRSRALMLARHVFADAGAEEADEFALQVLRKAGVTLEEQNFEQVWDARDDQAQFSHAWNDASGPQHESLTSEQEREMESAWNDAENDQGFVDEFEDAVSAARRERTQRIGREYYQFVDCVFGWRMEIFDQLLGWEFRICSGKRFLERNSSSEVVDTLRSENADDPRFAQSRFVRFMEEVASGAVDFRGNEVVRADTDPNALETAFQESHSAAETDDVYEEVFAGDPSTSSAQYRANDADELDDEQAQELADLLSGDEEAYERLWASALDSANIDETGEEIFGGGDTFASVWDADEDATSDISSYEFQQNNPYLNDPDPLARGEELLAAGRVPEAVLAFEAAVQRDESSAHAWHLLGVSQAECDDDDSAVERDPAHLDALLALGVSHTNNLERSQAVDYLLSWLRAHPRYAPLVDNQAALEGDPLRYTVDLFQRAAEQFPEDSNLWTVLGVLHNVARQFDRAIESFERALEQNDTDHSLWNKLGATQANSNRSTEALYAYHRALELRPEFVRALVNLGISYSNQGMYEDAIRCFLRGLSLNPSARHQWSYVRSACACLERPDLLEKCDMRDVEAFRDTFDF